MPIRTNRGRAAVYRRLWGWPLRSPRHLVVSAVVVLVLAVVIAIIVPGSKSGNAGQQTGLGASTTTTTQGLLNPPATSSSTPSVTATRLSAPLETPTTATPAPQALSVAEQWGRAWVDHPAGITNAQWLAKLKPFTTDEYLPVMSSVDPANIPASKVTGPAKATSSYTSSVEVSLPTDGGNLDITVIQTPQGWRVAGYTKA